MLWDVRRGFGARASSFRKPYLAFSSHIKFSWGWWWWSIDLYSNTCNCTRLRRGFSDISIRVTQFLFWPWSKLYEVFASMYSFLYLYLYLYVYLYLCPFLFLGRCVQGASPRVWEVSRASASGQPRWKAGVQNGSLAIGRWFKDNPLGKTTLDNMCIVVSF